MVIKACTELGILAPKHLVFFVRILQKAVSNELPRKSIEKGSAITSLMSNSVYQKKLHVKIKNIDVDQKSNILQRKSRRIHN